MSPQPKDAIASNQSLGLEIALDRPSRTYHPGERVTGKLIIDSKGISLVGKRTEISLPVTLIIGCKIMHSKGPFKLGGNVLLEPAAAMHSMLILVVLLV